MQYTSFGGAARAARGVGAVGGGAEGTPTDVVRHGTRPCNAAPVILSVVLLGLVAAPVARTGLLGEAALDDATHAALAAPGSEVRIDTPTNDAYMMVYVPSDYDPVQEWPLIVCYHGYRGRPTTWPFRQATEGEGFLIAGVEYGTEAYGSRLRHEQAAPEEAHFKAVLNQLTEIYNVDTDRVFMGGFSQGGYSTTVLGERLGDQLAGLIVLGAGRTYVDGRRPVKNAIWRKPVFVGCGEDDEVHYPRAVEAAGVYRGWGADVTFEGWEGVGHTFNADRSTALGEWLREHAAGDPHATPQRVGGGRVIVR
jgi:predicted esterase